MQWKLIDKGNNKTIEGRYDVNGKYTQFASIDSDSQLMYESDLPEKVCKEIIEFLHSQCIHVDEKGVAWKLIN